MPSAFVVLHTVETPGGGGRQQYFRVYSTQKLRHAFQYSAAPVSGTLGARPIERGVPMNGEMILCHLADSVQEKCPHPLLGFVFPIVIYFLFCYFTLFIISYKCHVRT